jgi:hypothetical protein
MPREKIDVLTTIQYNTFSMKTKLIECTSAEEVDVRLPDLMYDRQIGAIVLRGKLRGGGKYLFDLFNYVRRGSGFKLEDDTPTILKEMLSAVNDRYLADFRLNSSSRIRSFLSKFALNVLQSADGLMHTDYNYRNCDQAGYQLPTPALWVAYEGTCAASFVRRGTKPQRPSGETFVFEKPEIKNFYCQPSELVDLLPGDIVLFCNDGVYDWPGVSNVADTFHRFVTTTVPRKSIAIESYMISPGVINGTNSVACEASLPADR